MMRRPIAWFAVLTGLSAGAPVKSAHAAAEAAPSVVLVAERQDPSTWHAHVATAELLSELLRDVHANPPVRTVVIDEKKARESRALEGASAVVLLGREGSDHLLVDAAIRANVARLVDRGGGLVLVHGSAAPPENLAKQLQAWAGGVLRAERGTMLVNWPAGFARLPEHPVTQALEPFSIDDRWMSAKELASGKVLPLLQTDPPEYARSSKSTEPETMAWVYERPKGGRTFVYGGGHFFESYRDPSLRRLLTHAILWTAKVAVPTQ